VILLGEFLRWASIGPFANTKTKSKNGSKEKALSHFELVSFCGLTGKLLWGECGYQKRQGEKLTKFIKKEKTRAKMVLYDSERKWGGPKK